MLCQLIIKHKGVYLQKGLIVGIDPGTTTGMAILDMKGNLLFIWSKREAKKNEVIENITKFGRPLIVASDVTPLPKGVEKIASSMGSKSYYPEIPLSTFEKTDMIKDYAERISDEHQKDALAAALKAYKNYRGLFAKVDDALINLDLQHMFEDVVSLLLKEESANIIDAVNGILKKQKKPLIEQVVKKKEGRKPEEYEVLIKKLQEKLAQKETDIDILKSNREYLKKYLLELKRELRKKSRKRIVTKELESFKYRMQELEKEIQELKKNNELLKKIEKIRRRDLIPLIEVDEINYDSLFKLDQKVGLEDKVILSDALEDLAALNKFDIATLVRKSGLPESTIKKLEFPVIFINEDVIETVENIKVIRSDVFEKELKKARKEGLIKWLEKYRERAH